MSFRCSILRISGRLNLTEEQNSPHVRKPSKKSSVAVYFVLMLIPCICIGAFGEALGVSPLISWGLEGVLLLGAIYWGLKIEMKHRENHPKQIWEKAQAKRTAIVTIAIAVITTILAILGQGPIAIGFLVLSVVLCLVYLWAYELVEPYVKDRKSAIQLAIAIIVIVFVVAVATKQFQKPHSLNHEVPRVTK